MSATQAVLGWFSGGSAGLEHPGGDQRPWRSPNVHLMVSPRAGWALPAALPAPIDATATSAASGVWPGRRRLAGVIDPKSAADDLPALTDPVAVVAFEGWNDAGDAATGAVEHLELIWDATPLAALDPEDYYDFQVNRPTVSHVGGVSRRVEWPTPRGSVARPPGTERDVV